MNENIQTILKFDRKAVIIYATLFKEFAASVRNLNRKLDENVFRMQTAKFADTLKFRLSEQAKKILDRSDAETYPQLQSSLSAKLSYYVQQFKIKCNGI